MRTLRQMQEAVLRLAHDTANKTYAPAAVQTALADAFNDLVDRLAADPLGFRVLVRLGPPTAPDAAGAVPLPADCLRLVAVHAAAADGRLARLERLPRPEADWSPDAAAARAERLGARAPAAVLPGAAGGGPLGWSPAPDGQGIELVPTRAAGGTVRLEYAAAPPWPASTQLAPALPEGADELLELLAADKLTADEPRDRERTAQFWARFEHRWRRWVAGRARARIAMDQAAAGE